MKILSIDDMLGALQMVDHPRTTELMTEAEALADRIAAVVAEHFKVSIGRAASCELGFGGTCVDFRPSFEGQECPDAIDCHDEGGDW
jgi:hypothetical protein